MRISKALEARLAGSVPWLVAGGLSAEIGLIQMAQPDRLGVICGLHQGAGHCAACYAAVALVMVGLVKLAQPRKALVRVKA